MTPPRMAFLVVCSVIGAVLLVVSAVIVAEDGAEHYATVATVAPSTTTSVRGGSSSSTARGSTVPTSAGVVPSVTATVPPVTPPPVATTGATTATTQTPTTPVVRPFVTVLHLNGTGDQKSPTLTLTGVQARVQYQSAGPFTAYLLPAAQTGGHTTADQPIARCVQACPVPIVNVFADQAGSFYLDIVASSSWSVEIDEAR